MSAQPEDTRPDWLKAAAYEAMYFRQQFDDLEKHLTAAAERAAKAREWFETLCTNLDQHTREIE